jgi:hypothetical protein
VIATGSSDGMIRLVQIHPSKLLGVIAEHVSKVTHTSGDEDGSDSEDEGQEGFPIERMALDWSGKWLGSISHDETLKLTNIEDALEGIDSENSNDEDNSDEEDEEDDDDDDDEGNVATRDLDMDEQVLKHETTDQDSDDEDEEHEEEWGGIPNSFETQVFNTPAPINLQSHNVSHSSDSESHSRSIDEPVDPSSSKKRSKKELKKANVKRRRKNGMDPETAKEFFADL